MKSGSRRISTIAAILGLAFSQDCLPSYELTEQVDAGTDHAVSTGGTGGSVTTGGAAGTAADAQADVESDAPDAQSESDADGSLDPCPDGPYGTEKLYFGAPSEQPAFELGSPPSDPGEQAMAGIGYLSPDGLRFIQERGAVTNTQGCSGTCFKSREYARLGWNDDWSGPNATTVSFIQSFWAGRPHMFLQNLGLMSCHGGGLHCVFYARNAVSENWPFGYGGDSDHFEYYKQPPFQGDSGTGNAFNYAFTPTPDGRTIAFCSNRKSASDNTPKDATGYAGAELWTAESVDTTPPIDPTQNYQNLKPHSVASSPNFADTPEWISDDARMLIFTSRSVTDGSVELYLTTRASVSDDFGAAVKLSSLSDPALDESAFSIPSLSALGNHGNKGTGYLRRAQTQNLVQYFEFPVCLGSPNP